MGHNYIGHNHIGLTVVILGAFDLFSRCWTVISLVALQVEFRRAGGAVYAVARATLDNVASHRRELLGKRTYNRYGPI